MFNIIEPHAHEFYEKEIDSILGLLKIYQNFYFAFAPQARATFIVAEDNKRGVYGGAVLYPRKTFSSLTFTPEDTNDERLGKIFSSFQPESKKYWTARICLCLGNDTSASLLEAVELYQRFYRRLYEQFLDFGEKEKIEYLTFTLRPTDAQVDNTFRLLTYQTWPYLLEVRLKNPADRLFHGILSLKGNPFKTHREMQKFLHLRPFSKAKVLFEGPSVFEEGGASS